MAEAPVLTSIETVRKWHALAERRRRYYVELYRSERWRRYYTEEAFLKQMRDVIECVDQWAKVLGLPTGDGAQTAPDTRAA
jgi:uncharacterized repeat protein (TIGR03809 family)